MLRERTGLQGRKDEPLAIACPMLSDRGTSSGGTFAGHLGIPVTGRARTTGVTRLWRHDTRFNGATGSACRKRSDVLEKTPKERNLSGGVPAALSKGNTTSDTSDEVSPAAAIATTVGGRSFVLSVPAAAIAAIAGAHTFAASVPLGATAASGPQLW